MDVDTGETIVLEDTDLSAVVNNITFSATQQLQENHRYTVTVSASNIAGSAISRAWLSKYL